MSLAQAILFALAMLFIGISKGGLGGPLPVGLVVPMLSLVMDPRDAVVLIVPFLIIADGFALRIYWGQWSKRQHLILLIPAAVVGVVMGALLLARIPPTPLKIIVALVTLLMIVYKLAGERLQSIQYEPRNWHGYLAGWASGLVSTLASNGGPPFAVYMLLQDVQPVAFIGTATLVFAVINVLKLPLFFQQGLLDFNQMFAVLWAVPLLPVGVWIGRQALNRINAVFFERLMLALLLVSVILLLSSL